MSSRLNDDRLPSRWHNVCLPIDKSSRVRSYVCVSHILKSSTATKDERFEDNSHVWQYAAGFQFILPKSTSSGHASSSLTSSGHTPSVGSQIVVAHAERTSSPLAMRSFARLLRSLVTRARACAVVVALSRVARPLQQSRPVNRSVPRRSRRLRRPPASSDVPPNHRRR